MGDEMVLWGDYKFDSVQGRKSKGNGGTIPDQVPENLFT